jgi:nitrite reductase/ring-hydroxylating ferredoxin subunit
MSVTQDEHQPGFLCVLDDVPDGGAIGVSVQGDSGMPGVVVVRRGDHAWAYHNVCPHFSIPLNYEPDTFWTYDGEVLMCAHHSAMFHFEDGRCVDGPCMGSALTAVSVRVEGRTVVVKA